MILNNSFMKSLHFSSAVEKPCLRILPLWPRQLLCPWRWHQLCERCLVPYGHFQTILTLELKQSTKVRIVPVLCSCLEIWNTSPSFYPAPNRVRKCGNRFLKRDGGHQRFHLWLGALKMCHLEEIFEVECSGTLFSPALF